MAQLVEHILGKDEVPSSNLGSSSRKTPTVRSGLLVFLGLLSDSNCCSVAPQRSPVRISRPKIDKLAYQAQGVDIFTFGEYLGFSLIYYLGLLLQKTPDRQIGGFGFFGAAIRFEHRFRCIATKSGIAARSSLYSIRSICTITTYFCSLGKIPQSGMHH